MSDLRSAWVPAGVPYVAPTTYGTSPAFGGVPAYGASPFGGVPAYGGASAFGASPYAGNIGYAGISDLSNLQANTPQFLQAINQEPTLTVPLANPALIGTAGTVTAGGVMPTAFAGTYGSAVVPPTASYVRPAAPQLAEATQYARYVHPFPRQRTQARDTKRGFGLVDSWRRQANPEELHAWVYNPTPPSDDYF